MIELLHTDCMTYMSTLPDKAFDLAIVDPPYMDKFSDDITSKNRAKKRSYILNSLNDCKPTTKYFTELFRISKEQIIWGGNYFELPISPSWIVWQKFLDIEIQFNYKPFELAWSSINKSMIFKYLWSGYWQGNMKYKENRIHPTQKPIQLYKWLLKNYATPDMKIIDTHLGSGSSAIAAYDFGCDFVGCEIDADYYAAALKRFNIYKMQTKLF